MDKNSLRQNFSSQWSTSEAKQWYDALPYLKGSNFVPSSASNQLEMWQGETFDPARIDLELQWAENIGMNTMRIFLHDLLWKQDSEGFKDRINEVLTICERHKIKPMLVLFDSVWDPNPKAGPQPEPIAGVHNSRWVQSPGKAALTNPDEYPRLESYVRGVVSAFAKDERILAWDIWNEPDNINGYYGGDGELHGSYFMEEPPNKLEAVERLLPQAFSWVRSEAPIQPLTCGLWQGDWSSHENLTPIQKIQIENSDIISFHNYGPQEDFETRAKFLQRYQRPMMCTEYMARPLGNDFATTLKLAKEFEVATYNWGFVKGRSQTNLPWSTWEKPDENPDIWFHDIFHEDGNPYRPEEISIIRDIG